jgi:HAD superfamily hydrolase (TIGR01549 family)
MRVEAVLFDLFDTLLLLEKDDAFYIPSLRKLHEFLVKNGINVSFQDFKRVYFEARDSLYTETEKSLEEPHFNVRVSRVLKRFGHDFDVSHPLVVGATEAFAGEFMRYVHLGDYTLDVLRRLHGKYKLGLVSNFAIPECAWKLLDKFGLKSFFDVVLVSGEINKRKPSPEIFERAINSLGVDASRTVFVGDMVGLDVKGARNVGISPILIERRPPERITDVKPDKVIRSLRELLVELEDY